MAESMAAVARAFVLLMTTEPPPDRLFPPEPPLPPLPPLPFMLMFARPVRHTIRQRDRQTRASDVSPRNAVYEDPR